ncbi:MULTISPECIES: response regulator [unclassified Colwellia]|uniref:response regulator n=1 Tax=unclassified Colwellia TaxID=196834 RepID=UPI0015F771BE|nr:MULTISPECIES: hypothetical protein [unclassified Colwellia]MBA6354905.1 hypothetical protein [Colwellia sp. BRX8-3]MBA6360257.1 hypothetical protein [Colwellia sp. BRX8-6]MBA6367670.1 hypothetical protein [Colwellia sp. BRX8-5]MBA6374712.1 hypothetical protein [Colwellia sp. BRX8-2]
MKILIVEDDLFKFSEIELLVNKVLDHSIINRCDNVYDAIKFLNSHTPDKLILDMSLPSHSARVGEGSPLSMPSGGIEIILELRYLKKFNIPIIILTQYPDIEIENEYYSIEESKIEIKELYGMNNLTVAYYENDKDEFDHSKNDWESETQIFLES